MIKPRVIEHDDVFVVRDDLFPGGTKARFIPSLFNGVTEVVYASPAMYRSTDNRGDQIFPQTYIGAKHDDFH